VASVAAKHAGLTIGVVLVVGALLALVFRGPNDLTAIGISGIVAIVIQLAAFSLSRVAGQGNLMARMGTGALLRLFALVAYAMIVVFVLKLPAVAALVSLAAFFFLSTLIEPLLIK
jgi:hypothetical protein